MKDEQPMEVELTEEQIDEKNLRYVSNLLNDLYVPGVDREEIQDKLIKTEKPVSENFLFFLNNHYF
jgi:hypothetical protein